MAFNKFAWTGQNQPMAPKPAVDPQHSQNTAPDTAWTTPPAGTGQGYPDAQPVDALMLAPGIQRDPSWAYGHVGTNATRAALAPVNGAYDTFTHARNVAQARSARAHSDTRTVRAQTHAYNPQPQGELGDRQGVDRAEGHQATAISGKAIVKSQPGGQFSDGPEGEFAPTGFRRGVSRRWASRAYSSPALGAMYSKNSLRGILPQIVAKPYNQRALAGPTESGIPSNGRFLSPRFVTPSMYTVPQSESDLAYLNPSVQSAVQPVIGTGVM